MREFRTNTGKKEERQINQVLNAHVKQARQGAKDVLARTTTKQHGFKGRKNK